MSFHDLIRQHPDLENALRVGDLSVFLGAGFSKIAGLPLWHELMAPLAESLQIPVDQDPIQIAQYYVNANAQGRYLLNKILATELSPERSTFSLAHQYLKELPLRFMLTTNFDQLVEKTFDQDPQRPYQLVITDDDLPYLDQNILVVVKVNGCLSRRNTMVITREDFENYLNMRPQMCDLIRTILATSTVLYLGTSFMDPIFSMFNAQVLDRLKGNRRPSYLLKLRSNRYEIEDFKRRGIEIIDLELPETATADQASHEVIKFMEQLVIVARSIHPTMAGAHALGPQAATGSSVNSSGRMGTPPSILELKYQTLLISRLGTGLSLQVNPDHIDEVHEYDLVMRQDLLDYKSGDFYSFRRLTGRNVSDRLSSFLLYSESSEQKSSFKETGVRAFDVDSKAILVVDPILNEDVMSFTHAFRIFFQTSIAPGERFDVAYCIRLPNELSVLSPTNEIMSISLARIKKKVHNLQFNVCLNMHPRSVMIECLDSEGNRVACTGSKPTVEEYKPQGWLEETFAINWSDTPFKISWGTNDVLSTLYIINYRV